LAVKPGNEFNAFGVVSQDMQLRLLALAGGDSVAVNSSFAAAADAAGLTEKGRAMRARNAEQFLAQMRQAMASREQIDELNKKLDRLERASYEALLEADEERRTARRELEELRERAFRITTRDGRTVRVYRDGDIAREEDGTAISPDEFRGGDIPAWCPTLQELRTRLEADRNSERRYSEVLQYRERLAATRDEAGDGRATEERADEIEAEIEAMPEPVRNRLDGGAHQAERGPEREFTPPGQGAAKPGPR
jgi:hypothetical protein